MGIFKRSLKEAQSGSPNVDAKAGHPYRSSLIFIARYTIVWLQNASDTHFLLSISMVFREGEGIELLIILLVLQALNNL